MLSQEKRDAKNAKDRLNYGVKRIESRESTENEKTIARKEIKTITLDEVYEKINFPVEKRPLYILGDKLPGEDIQVHKETVGMNAIVRKDTQEVLSIMSKRYNLVTHRFMVEKAIQCLDKIGVSYNINRLLVLDNGAQILIEFTLPRWSFEVGRGDGVDFRLFFRNSYNGTRCFDFSCGFFRLVCTNGLVVGEVLDRIRKKHTPSLDVGHAVESVTRMIVASKDIGYSRMMDLHHKKISVDSGIKMISEMIEEKKVWPKKYLEPVTMNFANKIDAYTNDNLFDVYNAFSRELNTMDSKGIHIDRTQCLNMKAFEGVYQYVR